MTGTSLACLCCLERRAYLRRPKDRAIHEPMVAQIRGVCRTCRTWQLAHVGAGTNTDQQFIDSGLLLPASYGYGWWRKQQRP